MHHWQDIVLAAGSLLFAIALVPSVIGKHKPSLATSLPTGVVLCIFSATYVTLSLWYAAITTALSASLWLILAAQKALNKSED
jgi:hypothetical protein